MACSPCRKCHQISCHCNEPQYVTDARAAATSAAASAAMVANDLTEVENILAEIQEIASDLSCWTIVSTEAELIAANTAGVGGILVNAAITLTAALNITIPVYFSPCGSIITNGNVLTISAYLSAGIQQIFVTSSGEVLFSIGSGEKVLLEWFGATGDGVTDDTAAIQTAFDATAGSYIPIQALPQKDYRVSSISVPERTTLQSDGFRNTGARFTANSNGPMFTFAVGASYIQFAGLILIGNDQASAIVVINQADQCTFNRCNFAGATRGLDFSAGGTRIYIDQCKFGSILDYPVYISLVSNFIYIRECDFSGTSIQCIFADALWTGDSLIITDSTFESDPTALEDIHLTRPLATPGIHAVIERNRFDGAKVNSHIHLTQGLTVAINNNSMTGNVVQNIFHDGQFSNFVGNLFQNGTVGIALGANSDRNFVGHNFPNGVTTYVTDAGGRNSIFRRVSKDVTASRPVPISTEFGVLYLDTTLNANGQPIFWNGTAWVDGTGAIV